jgi:hypothetical protein
MGSQAGGQIGGMAFMLAGRLLGSFLGGPIGGAIGGLAGGMIGSLLFNRGAKPLVPDGQLATSSYGHFIPILYGQGRFPATVIWETDIESKKHGLGKGQTSYTYEQSAAFAFCQGPARLLKCWLDGKLFYDNTSAFPHEIDTKHPFTGRIYNGTEDQLPDPLIDQWVNQHVAPLHACPAYRGLAYFVFQTVTLNTYGNRMPNVTASWATDWEDKMIATKMQKSDGSREYLQGVATDWQSARLYTLENPLTYPDEGDAVVRIFEMTTGIEIKKATINEILSNAAGVALGIPLPVWVLGGGIATCQGEGDLYVTFLDGNNQPWIVAIDTSNMRAAYGFQLDFFSGHPGIFNNNWPGYLFPFSVQAYGYDPQCMILVGTWNWESWFLVNPRFGWSALLPTYYNAGYPGGYFSTACIGSQDTISGTTELWIAQAEPGILGLGRDRDFLRIHKVFVAGTDPAGARCEVVATLLPDDTGSINSVVNDALSFWWGINIVYDPSDDTLIISCANGQTIFKWKEGLGTIWLRDDAVDHLTGGVPMGRDIGAAYTFLGAGRVGTGTGYDYRVYQTLDGKVSPTYSAHPDPGVASAGLFGYSSQLNAAVVEDLGDWTQVWVIYLERAKAGEVPVAAILRDLCLRAGIDDASIDVSGVSATTIGYSIVEEKSFGAAVMDLCHTFQIDVVESDYKLKFIERGQGAIATIQQSDLASSDTNDPSKYWEQKRAIEQEMPLQINLKYSDVDLDFQPGAAFAKRIAAPVPTVFSRRVKTLDLPVVSRNPDVRHIAERWLYVMWAERDTYKTMTGQKYLWLDPGDNITVAFEEGDTITARVQQTELGDDYTIKLDLCSEDVETFVMSSSPGAHISYKPQTVVQTGMMDLLQFNIPLLQDADDTGGTEMRIYYAAGGTAPLSPNATADLYQSLDGTAWPVFSRIASFADWGTASNALGDTVAAFATDYTNTLTYTPIAGSATPVSCTYEDVMNGANPVLVGREIVQFQTAVRNENGSYTLSILQRGRRGTEWACGQHVEGELVVLLEVGKIQAGRQPLSLRNVTTMWKLVPAGRFIDSTSAESFAYRAFDLMPYAPVNAKRTFTGADLLLSWIRRTRLGGLLVDGTDTAPLGEDHEEYEVYLLDSPDDLPFFDPSVPATYRRAFVGLTSPTLTYTAAMMAADGFSIATSTVYAVIYQLSAVVGRGFPGFHVLPPPGGSLTVGLENGSGSWTGWIWG